MDGVNEWLLSLCRHTHTCVTSAVMIGCRILFLWTSACGGHRVDTGNGHDCPQSAT